MCRSYSELLPYVAARSFFRTGRICWTARSMVCGVLHAKCFRDWMYSPCSPTINNVGIGAACGPTGVHTRTRLCTTMSLTSRAGQASQMLSVMTNLPAFRCLIITTRFLLTSVLTYSTSSSFKARKAISVLFRMTQQLLLWAFTR